MEVNSLKIYIIFQNFSQLYPLLGHICSMHKCICTYTSRLSAALCILIAIVCHLYLSSFLNSPPSLPTPSRYPHIFIFIWIFTVIFCLNGSANKHQRFICRLFLSHSVCFFLSSAVRNVVNYLSQMYT